MKKVGIVFPTLNNFKGLAEAIASVDTSYDWTPYVYPNWRLNDPLAKAWNEGSKQAIDEDCTHILICNDDILFSPYTIDALVEHIDKYKDCVLVSGADQKGSLSDPYQIFSIEQPKEVGVSEHPDFACFMIKPDTLTKIGEFDENFVPAYFEDNDYHYRINLLGFKAQATSAAPYYHFGSQTQNASDSGPVVPSYVFEKNRAYFESKWGGWPGKETFKHPFDDKRMSPREWKGY